MRSSIAPYLDDAEILEFPAWETLPHERLSPSAETVGRRLHALRRIGHLLDERTAIVHGG